ncbi:hypothetical protein TNIN_209271 [Trichonephila inaurata madagascariensis]|uniref:Uncharacterized protein n=1 Tax=Trichonephila inaurata madagascariensis TaxID=2747483 RepID=A0A8X6XBD7_9ARAC|nr:hypothetical protein TNIN_209271 [Trichonephila inaurata madagascariensis]
MRINPVLFFFFFSGSEEWVCPSVWISSVSGGAEESVEVWLIGNDKELGGRVSFYSSDTNHLSMETGKLLYQLEKDFVLGVEFG